MILDPDSRLYNSFFYQTSLAGSCFWIETILNSHDTHLNMQYAWSTLPDCNAYRIERRGRSRNKIPEMFKLQDLETFKASMGYDIECMSENS